MRHLYLRAAVVVILSGLSACNKIKGEGPVVTQQRTTTYFTGIQADFSGDLFYTQDSACSITVSGQQNILDLLNTSVKGGDLVIGFDRNKRIGHHEQVRVYIHGPDVTSLFISGSGTLKVLQPYFPATLGVSVSGSGSISIPELHTGNVTTSISGSGNISILNGTATNISTDVSGSGTTDLLGVAAHGADIHIAGSGDTYVEVSDYLNVRISGSGNVYYRGRPAITTSIKGSGKVLPR